MRTINNLLFARFFPRNSLQKVLPATLSIKPVEKAHEPSKTETVSVKKIKEPKIPKFLLSRIDAACIYLQSQNPAEYVNQFILQSDTCTLKSAYKIFITLGQDEVIAFFTLAPYGVTLDEFSMHRKLFVTDKNYSFGIGNCISKSLQACEYLLKSGITFESAVSDLTYINHFSDSDARFMAVTYDKLPMQYAKTFNDAQIRLYNELRSGYLSAKEKSLAKQITPEKIAELKIPDDCDAYKLVSILRHLLITKKETWENTVRIVNGDAYKKGKTPTLFNSKLLFALDRFYIDEVLYSKIFRDKATELLNLPPELLNDGCTWFKNESDVKALSVLVEKTKEKDKSGLTVTSIAKKCIEELKELNSWQKWVVVVGGDLSEAKQMYLGRICNITHPVLFEERDALRDLEKFRQQRAENSASTLRM